METNKELLGENYRELYAPYYRNHGSDARKREISAAQSVDYLTHVLRDRVFDRLLDVGAGEGSVVSLLSERGMARELFAVEVSESGIEAIKAREVPLLCDALLFDGYAIPFPDKYFDLAIAVHVLEHVEHERLLLKEIRRVARRLYVEVPLELGFRIQRSIDSGKSYGHINFYTIETLRNLLESTGMKVVKCAVRASSLEYEQHLYGVTRGRAKNVFRKWALSVAPKLAPWFMTYNGYAYAHLD